MSNKKPTPKMVPESKMIKVMEQRDELLEAAQNKEHEINELKAAIEDQNNVIDHYKSQVPDTEVEAKSGNALVEIFTDPDPFKLIAKKVYLFEATIYNHYRELCKLYAAKPAPSPIPVSQLEADPKFPIYVQYVADAQKAQEESEEILYGIQFTFMVG